MNKGRCAGCGLESTVKAVLVHSRSCEKYADLFKEDFLAALLDPAAVYEQAHSASSVSLAVPSLSSAQSTQVSVEYWERPSSLLEDLASS